MKNDERNASAISEEEFMQLANEIMGGMGDTGTAVNDTSAGSNEFVEKPTYAPPKAEPEPVAPAPNVTISQAQFAPLTHKEDGNNKANLDMILDVSLRVTVELGRTSMTIRDILSLTPGSVVELDRLAGEPVDILVNDKLIAKGEVVVVDENFGVRVTDIVSPTKRIASFK